MSPLRVESADASWAARLSAVLSTVAPHGPGATRWRTRFAPAPTGYLHLGHLVNALHVWGIARAHGGEVLLRLEDHDRTRWRPAYEQALLDDLEWLGLEPDVWPVTSFRHDVSAHPARQSNQPARYGAALTHLERSGLLYPCRCTRRDIEQVAPHPPGAEPCYPGTCRNAGVPPAETFARRVQIASHDEQFDDLRGGRLMQNPARQCGDMLLIDRHDQWTYQFAVTVDDLVQHIDVVIRGEDLLSSTGRQLQLARLLGRATPPRFLHHALLVHEDGRKLSKATHDTALREWRSAGATPADLFGLAAHRAGLVATGKPIPVADIPALFS